MTASASLSVVPWRDIWVHPRSTLRAVTAAGPNHRALIFSAGWGVVQSLFQASQNNVGLRAPLLWILVAALVIGAIWGLLQVFLLSGLVYIVGRWTGVVTTYYPVQTVFAWGTLPVAASLVLWLGAALILGRPLFLSDQAMAATGRPDLLIGVGVLYLVTGALWIWSAVIIVLGLAEIQRVSVLRALGIMIVGLVMFAVAALLVLAFLMAAL